MPPQHRHDPERLNALKAEWEQTQPFEIRALAQEIRARTQAQEAAMQKATRKRTIGLMIGLSLALLLLIVLVTSAFLNSRAGTLPGTEPTVTIQDFWQAMESQDYQSAYGYFTLNIKNSMSIDQFTKQAQSLDQQRGIIISVTLLQSSSNSHSRFYSYRVARQRDSSDVERVEMVFDTSNNTWAIASLSGKLMTITP